MEREERVSPGHESSNPGPFAFCDEETDHRIGHSTPDFTDEQHHGGLEGVNLWSATGTRWNSQAHISIPAHFFIRESRFQCAYLSNVEQVDLQEESCGAGSHFLGRAADGKTQFAA